MKIFRNKRTGWSANALFIILLFVVIFVIVASFMPTVKDMIGHGVTQVSGGSQGTLLVIVFYGVPILLLLMLLYAIIVAVANR